MKRLSEASGLLRFCILNRDHSTPITPLKRRLTVPVSLVTGTIQAGAASVFRGWIREAMLLSYEPLSGITLADRVPVAAVIRGGVGGAL